MQPKGILKLQLPRLQLVSGNGVWQSGFSLTARQVTRTFFTKTKEIASDWFNKLRLRSQVVLLGLEKDYELGRVLGRGTSAKVNIAVNTHTHTQYAIKSWIKESLRVTPRKLVCMHGECIDGSSE